MGLAELLVVVEPLGLLLVVGPAELLVAVGLVALLGLQGAQGRRGGAGTPCTGSAIFTFCSSLGFSNNYFCLIPSLQFLYYFTTLFLFNFLISLPYSLVLVMFIYSLFVILFILLLYIKFLFSVILSCH